MSETRKLFNSTVFDYGITRNINGNDTLFPAERSRFSASVNKLPSIAVNQSIDAKESVMSKQDRHELVAQYFTQKKTLNPMKPPLIKLAKTSLEK